MIHKDLKELIDKYCMGIQPTDAQLDKIFDKVAEVNADPMEVDAYMKEMQAGPTKEQRAAEEAAKRKAEEEERKRKAAEEAAKRKAEEEARKLKEQKERKEAERRKREEAERKKAEAIAKSKARMKAEAEKKAAEAEEKIEFATTRKKHIKRFFFWGIGVPLLVLIMGSYYHFTWGWTIFVMSLVGGLINFICSVIAAPNDSDSKKMEELNTLYCFLHVGLTCICIVALIVCVIMYFWDKLFS